MTDENAFGLMVSYFDIEDDEYGLDDQAQFVRRFMEFRSTVLDWLAEQTLPVGAHALSLGHALYLEWPEPALAEDIPSAATGPRSPGAVSVGPELEPLALARELRARLAERDFTNVVVLSHGSRWVTEPDSVEHDRTRAGGTDCVLFSHPSEPLRRSLYAETATHAGDQHPGWGPGLYLDTEAVEALGKRPKNAPTLLEAAGAKFYRAGR